MKKHQIEAWSLRVIEGIKSGQSSEDSRVEVKSEWPEADRAARRIAAHANAARGESILWLIGVDEKGGVTGASKVDVAKWWSGVCAEFEGLCPEMADLIVPVRGVNVVALFFETDRAPFVVKNPAHGKSKGDSVSLEVPWREGTATRSATRSDLIKILSPLQDVPSFELRDGSLIAHLQSGGEGLGWRLALQLYVVSKHDSNVVIPFHRCDCSFEIPGVLPLTYLDQIDIEPFSQYSSRPSLTIFGTSTEVIINGAGMLRLHAIGRSSKPGSPGNGSAEIKANLLPAHAERPIIIRESLPNYSHLSKSSPSGSEWGRWQT